MSHSILTACILAHLNNIAEPGSFNKHLNYLLRKNGLPEFQADDDAPSHKIFNIASLSRAVTPSQEVLNEQMEEDDLLVPPEQPPIEPAVPGPSTEPTDTKKKPQPQRKKAIAPVTAKDLGIIIHTSHSKPFPKKIPYDHHKENIKKGTYKVTFTADKPMEEIINLIDNYGIRFCEDELKEIEDTAFKKIRPGKGSKSPLHKTQQKRTATIPWQ